MTNEKHTLTEEATRLITQIQQMQQSLDGTPQDVYDREDLRVAYPLKPCLQALQEKHKAVYKVHKERYEEVKSMSRRCVCLNLPADSTIELAQAIESYASHLEPSFLKVQLPPTALNASCPPTFDLSHTYFAALDDEFTRIYSEYERRLVTVKSLCGDIIQLWAELGTPQAQTDSNLVTLSREAPEQLGLHSDDLARLKTKRDKLVEDKRAREKRIKDLRTQIEQLYERLAVNEAEQKQFFSANRGCGMRTINEFEDELGRLNELKRQNLGLFVEETRIRLQELWDSLYFSEEEMLEFTPAFSDVYSDALLSAHESEIERLTALKDQRAPVLAMIDEHRSLVSEREELAASSQDASRLIAKKGERRDPTRLLREEKMRKRIQRELPKVEARLKKTLIDWEDEYGRPFLVLGRSYLDEIEHGELDKKPIVRSKTPLPGATSTTKVPTKGPAPATASRTGTVKKAPAPRSKTPTSIMRPLSRNQFSAAVAPSTGNKSPSRIPARVPLGKMADGGNSPDRKYGQITSGGQTVRSMAPPRMAPPKMQDLFSKSAIATPQTTRDATEDLRSGSIVRQVAPEDVYSDRQAALSHQLYHHQHQQPSSHHTSLSSTSGRPYTMAPPYSRPNSRQISATSATSSNNSNVTGGSNNSAAASGSENWETYDDASEAEPEADASDGYYARLRMQQQQQQQHQAAFAATSQAHHAYYHGGYEQPNNNNNNKRATPEGGYGFGGPRAAPAKKVRGLMAPPPPPSLLKGTVGEGAERVMSGSEAGWTDEDGL